MGAGEFFGSNRNADYWPQTTKRLCSHATAAGGEHKEAQISAGLQERAGTFVSHGSVYKDHKNTDDKLAKGEIYSAHYNPKMGRVEAVVFLKNAEWEDELAALDAGKHVPFSMSGRVPWDWCSYCGNKAASREQYCDHLKKHANAILSDGHQIVAINEKPTFFDLSGVRRNADRIGFGLAKIASIIDEPQKTGAALAAELGVRCPEEVLLKVAGEELQARIRLLKKLSAIEKEIEAEGRSAKGLTRAVDPRLSPPMTEAQIIVLRSTSPGTLFKNLAAQDIVLPMEGLFKLLLGDSYQEHEKAVKEGKAWLPGLFTRIRDTEDLEAFLSRGRYTPDPASFVPLDQRKAADELAPLFSTELEAVKHRLAVSAAEHGDAPAVTLEKHAAPSSAAQLLAREYGRYVVASLQDAGNDGCFLAVLRNYV
jgi:hypothetical protein